MHACQPSYGQRGSPQPPPACGRRRGDRMHLTIPEKISWAATALCVWLCITSAFAGFRHRPRLFSVLSIFALNWAILLPYYEPGPPKSELLAAFSGFVHVYAGIILRAEFHERAPNLPEPRYWRVIDSYVLALLGIIILPQTVDIVFAPIEILSQIHEALGTLMIVVGFFSVLDAVTRTQPIDIKHFPGILFPLVTVLYALVEIAFSAWAIINTRHNQQPAMSIEFRYLFAGLKLAYTGLFISRLKCWKNRLTSG